MNRQKSFEKEKGILYLIPSPIGNMQDISLRAIDTIKVVDFLFCEDTRVTNKLLMKLNIEKNLGSFHEFNKDIQKEKIINLLKQGYNVGLISDAGMPLVSDPGYEAVTLAIENDIPVVAIPGASALLTGLITSGIKPYPFIFYGFLSHKESERKKELQKLMSKEETLIFYEAPHRIKETLKNMYEIFGDRHFAIARELTKIHEEIIRGTLKESLELTDLIGEMVIIVEGQKEETPKIDLSIKDHINLYLQNGFELKEAMKKVAKDLNTSKSEVYDRYLKEVKES